MKDLRRKLNRFLYNNNDKGIPNLMLYISVGTLLVYFLMVVDPSYTVYNFICFDRGLILRGQVWRLFTYIFVPQSSGIWLFLLLFAYYGIGRMIEATWGTLKFNLFYLCGVIIMDVGAMILNVGAGTYYLNLSLFLALATLYPENRVMLMYIIPLKMKYLAWAYLLLMVYEVVQLNFFPVFALLNYFIFFGRDCLNVLPGGGRFQRNTASKSWAKAYKKPNRSASQHSSRVVDQPAYRHKCAVCGRTDVSDPQLDFRYCSRCNGYYCYCEDHINNHTHIQ